MAFENLQYAILKRFFPLSQEEERGSDSGPAGFSGRKKLERLLGHELIESLKGRVVVDFGCGEGYESVALAQAGAEEVIGLDIREDILQSARRNAKAAGVSRRCHFVRRVERRVDTVISIDAFEHFADPLEMLTEMERLLVPGGQVIVSFGPTWYHPLGGHLFSIFPWSHLLFSEKALLRWRSDYRPDGARHFADVAGGLNQMTIRRFEALVSESRFQFVEFEAVPISRLRFLHNRFTREFSSAIVRCRLVRRAEAAVAFPVVAQAAEVASA